MSAFKVWECQICNWIYDEAKGCPEEGLEPGTRWEDVPEDWCCPECGVGKADFEMLELSRVSDGDKPGTGQSVEKAPAKADTNSNTDGEDEAFSSDTELPVIIIGSGLAGYQLARELRRLNAEQAIVMYTADDGAYYSKPKLSEGFSANKSASDLVTDTAESMAQKLDIEINIHTRISQIDLRHKCIHLEQGGSRNYDKLVLAAGANCIVPPLSGNGTSKVHKVNDLSDYAKFRTLIKPKSRILVMGAGLIGCEYADDLTRAGHSVTVVDPIKGALANLMPEVASKVLTDNLRQAGITFHLERLVSHITHKGSGVSVQLDNGEQLNADLVLSAVGIRPNVQLAKTAGLATERGVSVDKSLQTSDANVYALGDCAEVAGMVLPYIAPLSLQVKALAKTLSGALTQVQYGVMPILVKTKLHPVVVNPPLVEQGKWLIDIDQNTGVKARFIDDSGRLQGYALTGDQCRQNAGLQRACQPPKFK